MLTNAFRVLVNNLFQESFDIIFMGNEKNIKTLIAFFFHNFFLNGLLTNVLRALVSIFLYFYNIFLKGTVCVKCLFTPDMLRCKRVSKSYNVQYKKTLDTNFIHF